MGVTEPGDQPTRRALLAAAGAILLAGCTGGPLGSSRRETPAVATTGTATETPSPTTSPTSTVPARDPAWVAAENARPGTRGWRIGRAELASESEVAGYTDRVSALPGEQVRLHLSSTRGDVTVRAFRLGDYQGAGAREVWTSSAIAAHEQRRSRTDRLGTVRCQWPVSTELDTTDWPEGSYLLRLEAGGRARYVPLTIRSHSTTDRVVLVSAVTCYQAYNTWGGHSLYKGPDGSFATRASVVSFDRPYAGNGAQHVTTYEQGAIAVAESLGVDLAYTTSVELHAEPDLLHGARGVVSLGARRVLDSPDAPPRREGT